jgi:hypothetical protein
VVEERLPEEASPEFNGANMEQEVLDKLAGSKG